MLSAIVIVVVIEKDDVQWCCHHGIATAKVHLVYFGLDFSVSRVVGFM